MLESVTRGGGKYSLPLTQEEKRSIMGIMKTGLVRPTDERMVF
jgi:hypothetical protein